MALITLVEYAQRIGKARDSVYMMYRNGALKSACKIGRDIMIDEDEPYVDRRIKSGVYRDWRKNIEAGRLRKNAENDDSADDEKN